MGVSLDLGKSPMLSGSFARVRIEDIVEVLEARFPGTLLADFGERLPGLDQEELKQVLRRCATAASIEEAISRPRRYDR